MAINPTMRRILKALSFGGIEVEASRHLADLKAIDPLKIFHKTIDFHIYNEDYEVPVRIYLPNEMEQCSKDLPVLLFFHGGGWVTESIDNYERICARMSKDTGSLVVSVGYRLAPEHKFPIGLYDCYAVARELFLNETVLNVSPSRITLIGDSAGGNLTAALSLLARERGEFMPQRQILIYPAVNNDYSLKSPFASVKENGTDFLLTAGKMQDYLSLYQSSEADRSNPYFAPIVCEDVSNQPKTLILTAEYDPLRDEGEAYGRKLEQAGNYVEMHRITDALHGFFALGLPSVHVQESFEYIRGFLKEV